MRNYLDLPLFGIFERKFSLFSASKCRRHFFGYRKFTEISSHSTTIAVRRYAIESPLNFLHMRPSVQLYSKIVSNPFKLIYRSPHFVIALFCLLPLFCWGQAVPSQAQLEWQAMEMNMFCHFGPNTFTGNEWGDGKDSDSLFNPTQLDCRQWVATAKAVGFKGIIITAKHHDGFCLWPSQESTHTVRESPCNKDVLRELSDACREQGLKFGVYVSPWDRNHPTYGSEAYNRVFQNTLKEVHTQYGEVFEQWFDGACGEGPNGKKQVYDFDAFNNEVLTLHPNCVIFSDVGPGCRWMGNESGVCGATCWSTMDIADSLGNKYLPGTGIPSQAVLNSGEREGQNWVPAETDVSIRPGWFWRASEHPKSVQELLSIYYTSVGRNSLLLLNVPPDNRGLIDREDSLRLMEFRLALDSIFSHSAATFSKKNVAIGPQTFHWQMQVPATFNRIVLQEDIAHGQRVAKFQVLVRRQGSQQEALIAEGTTIGYKRILLVPQQDDIETLTVRVTDCKGQPLLKGLDVFQDNIFDDSQLRETSVYRTTDNLK